MLRRNVWDCRDNRITRVGVSVPDVSTMILVRSYLLRRPTLIAAMSLLMALTLFSSGDPLHAQVTCTGHDRSLGLSFFGTPGDDLIDCRGTTANVVIAGLGGKDILIGGMGNDVIMGGEGEDIIFGRGGRDFLKGGSDRDLIFGSAGQDVLEGGPGNDLMAGGSGTDILRGGEGNDTMFGGSGIDVCDGQEGDDDFAASDCEGRRNVP